MDGYRPDNKPVRMDIPNVKARTVGCKSTVQVKVFEVRLLKKGIMLGLVLKKSLIIAMILVFMPEVLIMRVWRLKYIWRMVRRLLVV